MRMTGMVMSGKRSTDSLLSDTMPSTMSMSDTIKMKTGFLSASRVSHMDGYRLKAACPA
jgi:hypothetical protein